MYYLLFILASLPLIAAPFGEKEEMTYSIRMDNRPLVKLHGKVITLLDVVKDMDRKMAESSPETLLSPVSRIQFYHANWRDALELMIQNALIIKEAEELGVQLSDAQIYEEMEHQYGPNLIQALDKQGLSFEEAKQKTYDLIILNYMQWIRIHEKAQQNITPEKLQVAYADYLKENPPIETYSYQVVSVRALQGFYDEIVQIITPFLHNTNIPDVEGLVAKLQAGINQTQATVQVSKPYHVNASQMSEEHLTILSKLLKNTCSEPLIQKSRQDSTPVMRIFYLIDHQKQEIPSFSLLETQLKNQLLQQESQKAHQEYISKLRKKYYCDRDDFYQMIPDNYQPFALE